MAIGQEPTNGEGSGREAGRARPREDARRLKEKALGAAREAGQRGKSQLEARKGAAAEQVQRLAGVVERAAGDLGQEDGSLARYASELAGSMNRFAEGLQNRSVDQLMGDVQSLARRNPALFLLGSVALGVVLARFLKASGEREHGTVRAVGASDDTYARTVGESQGPGTELAHTFTPPAGTTASPLQPPAIGTGYEREDA